MLKVASCCLNASIHDVAAASILPPVRRTDDHRSLAMVTADIKHGRVFRSKTVTQLDVYGVIGRNVRAKVMCNRDHQDPAEWKPVHKTYVRHHQVFPAVCIDNSRPCSCVSGHWYQLVSRFSANRRSRTAWAKAPFAVKYRKYQGGRIRYSGLHNQN